MAEAKNIDGRDSISFTQFEELYNMLFGGKERSSPSPSTSRRFGRTGQRFKIGARVLHNRRPAKIARMNRDRTFNIKYMDGDGEVIEGVERSELQLGARFTARKINKCRLSRGS